ncbi:uncharacterized protein [Tursiops truncatus]|uniref:uncharacterized protein n=1 Tax=Tursiops truncatus TaxID=9739 RepID=UPI003CCF1E1A
MLPLPQAGPQGSQRQDCKRTPEGVDIARSHPPPPPQSAGGLALAPNRLLLSSSCPTARGLLCVLPDLGACTASVKAALRMGLEHSLPTETAQLVAGLNEAQVLYGSAQKEFSKTQSDRKMLWLTHLQGEAEDRQNTEARADVETSFISHFTEI